MSAARYQIRRVNNAVFLALSLSATAIALVALSLILWSLLQLGFGALSLDVFTKTTPPPGEKGGLLNAVVGSLMMNGIAVGVGTPVGILAGTYLAEYGKNHPLSVVARFINDILLSAPSIVLGLFIYELVVVRMQHFSGWAGCAALTLLVIPIVVRTTENSLALVPDGLREAAVSVGAPRYVAIQKVTWRAAQAGVLTGVLLAIARIFGETAPLLFTALNHQYMSTDMNQPIASLPVVIYQFALSPYVDWQKLAWAGALLITVVVLLLNVLARVIGSRGVKSK